jgi:hypothetical protein
MLGGYLFSLVALLEKRGYYHKNYDCKNCVLVTSRADGFPYTKNSVAESPPRCLNSV